MERFWGPNSIPKAIQNLIDFGIDFLTILARFGSPSCGHVGDIFGKNGAREWGPPRFDVIMLYVDEFWRFRGRFWSDFGPSRTDFGPILDRFLAHFGLLLVAFGTIFVIIIIYSTINEKLRTTGCG